MTHVEEQSVPEVTLPEDPWDFEDVYQQRWGALVRLAYATTGSLAEAEEIVQDVFVQLFRHRESVSSPAPWLRTAVTHAATSWLRRLRLERRHARPDTSEAMVPPVTAEFLALLQPLPRRQRAVLFLRYHEGLSEQEIASVLGCRPGSVKSMNSRALTRLRERLNDA